VHAATNSADAVFDALSDRTRPTMLAALAAGPPPTATQLAADLPISRQTVINHLTALTDAGLLERERSGREVRYRVTPAPGIPLLAYLLGSAAAADHRPVRHTGRL
jgi:DNA-binding transcriptional ArsR family regulator